MWSIIIGLVGILVLGGLITWCFGGEFLEGARETGGCILEIIFTIIGIIVVVLIIAAIH